MDTDSSKLFFITYPPLGIKHLIVLRYFVALSCFHDLKDPAWRPEIHPPHGKGPQNHGSECITVTLEVRVKRARLSYTHAQQLYVVLCPFWTNGGFETHRSSLFYSPGSSLSMMGA